MAFRRLLAAFPGLCLLGALAAPAALAKTPEEAFAQAQPILKKYCFKCHSPEKKEGEFDLARFDSLEKANEDRKVWETVQGRFFAREMPPEGSPQPNDEERDRLRHWLDSMVKEDGSCNKLANDRNTNFFKGHVMSRRLTRTEYANSIRDLLGVDIGATDRLPSDGAGGEGFDSTGDSLFLSPIHLEKYLDTAELVAATLWPEQSAAHEPAAVRAARARIGGHVVQTAQAPREAAEQALAPVIRRAFRRPVSAEEQQRYLALYDRAVGRGESHLAGLRLALQGMLMSPHFLFLAEPEPEKDGVYPLPAHPLAARLAMFLWSSLPDEELLAAADRDELQADEQLKAQVRRMLQDPRARALGENFAMQWLGLTQLGGASRPDPGRFPEFTPQLAAAMRGETAEFFAHLFQDNRSLLELIDADYAYVNEPLAQLYGLPAAPGGELRKVSLPDRTRGGVLTQASVLTVSSYPFRTSPVLRGRWLLEEVLGSRVPPPPPGVPPLPAEGEEGAKLSLREQLEKHRSNPQCATCHSRMDPLGFGLENFDPIGRWRTEVNGQPIDATGVLPSGEKFNGPAELKKILLNRKHDVLRHLTRKLYGYALGRELNKFDDCVIKETMEALKKDEYRAVTLVDGLVLSYPFRHRYCKK